MYLHERFTITKTKADLYNLLIANASIYASYSIQTDVCNTFVCDYYYYYYQ